jgi:[acyl-carrier-protein] S-malonyltransferase
VSCANYNSPGQVVIAGAGDAVGRAMEAAREAGARRAVPLPVSVASHCELMLPAAEHMQTRLLETDLSVAGIPVVHNVDVRPHVSADDIRDLLVRQLTAPVRWTATIEWLIGQGVDRFAECGPGKVLTGLNRRISREVETTALVSWDAIIETKANWS